MAISITVIGSIEDRGLVYFKAICVGIVTLTNVKQETEKPEIKKANDLLK